MKIVITDCDHGAIDEEAALARSLGIELVLAECRTEEDVIVAAQGADGIVVQNAPVGEAALAALPTLKAIGRYGVGVDTIDVEAATRHRVAVCNVPDYGTEDVSDHAIALTLSLVRGITQLDREVRAGSFDLASVKPLHRIRDLTLGVVGLGPIGRATARKAGALGFRVLGTDVDTAAAEAARGLADLVELDILLAESDLVSIHVPLLPATQGLIGAEALAKMRRGASLINTGRGAVVDTAALVASIRSGHIKGAALDVFDEEPLPADSALRDLPSVVLTPHAGWYSEQSYSELKRRAFGNVADVCRGSTPENILNPGVLS